MNPALAVSRGSTTVALLRHFVYPITISQDLGQVECDTSLRNVTVPAAPEFLPRVPWKPEHEAEPGRVQLNGNRSLDPLAEKCSPGDPEQWRITTTWPRKNEGP